MLERLRGIHNQTVVITDVKIPSSTEPREGSSHVLAPWRQAAPDLPSHREVLSLDNGQQQGSGTKSTGEWKSELIRSSFPYIIVHSIPVACRSDAIPVACGSGSQVSSWSIQYQHQSSIYGQKVTWGGPEIQLQEQTVKLVFLQCSISGYTFCSRLSLDQPMHILYRSLAAAMPISCHIFRG